MKILLGITGSVASVLTDKLVKKLIGNGHEVKVIATDKAYQFLERDCCVYTFLNDKDEFYDNYSYHKDDKVLHIELREWADCFLIAPCSLNTMAKMANGICDNLLTSIFRSWDFTKPIYVSPCANTKMWLHPITKSHLDTFKQWKVNVIYPTVKKLACGEYGVGALADLDTIVNITEGHRWYRPFLGGKYLPLSPHIGSFGAKRKHEIHTGVDKYYTMGESVAAMEDGEVISIGQFTGKALGHDWWNDTWHITIKGKSGNIVYGEIKVDEQFKVGDKVKAGDFMGTLLEVVKEPPRIYVEGHDPAMLHVELLRELSECPYWKVGEDRPKGILDPTPYLYLLEEHL